MPTYKSRTVDATLYVAKLADTLSPNFDELKGTAYHHDAKQREKILSTGDPLYERPIGADGSETRTIRFIGEFKDMPFLLAEAGEHIVHGSEKYSIVPTIETPPPKTAVPDLAMEDTNMDDGSSPLTSLGNTPSFHTPQSSFIQDSQQEDKPRHDSVIDSILTGQTSSMSAPQMLPGFKSKQYQRDPLVEAQALSLTLEFGCNSCPKNQDLKMEVFLNGALVDSEYINTKRYSLLSQVHKQHFHGNRLHVQVEKPWIYRGADQASQSQLTGEERWAAVGASLAEEVNFRGCNAKGMPWPSAEYLNALSSVALPDCSKEMAQSSIIDVVVTSGRGCKFNGGNHPFLTGPLRMSNPKLQKPEKKVAAEEDPFTGETASMQTDAQVVTLEDEPQKEQPTEKMDVDTDLSNQAAVIPSTSPEVPLARRTRFQSTQKEPPPKQESVPGPETETASPWKRRTAHTGKIDALATELGLTPHKTKLVTSFKDRRGKERTPRMVKDRLCDILKMNLGNQEKAKQDLLAQLAKDGISLAKLTSTGGSGFSPEKAKTADPGPAPTSRAQRRRSTRNQEIPHADDVLMPDVTDDPVAALAQARMDTALDFGAPPGGHLAKRIESLSPHRSPVKRLGATTWGSGAEEKTSEEENSQVNAARNVSASPTKLRRGRSRPMTDASNPATDVSDAVEQMLDKSEELPIQPPAPPQASKPDSSKSGSTKNGESKKSAAPSTGPTQEEAMAAFEAPKICQGGSISYADAGHRAVVKIRPGEFNEQEFVVGMRFIVL